MKGPNANKTEPCIGPMRGKTFLNVYNCDYIRPPKPDRFARAMKQIYRTSFVLSHFVHYSTVTADLAQTFEENKRNKSDSTVALPSSKSSNMKELFMDELTQGVLIHARSVLTHEMRRRSSECYYGSRIGCMVGYLCDDTVIFVDELHKNNSFRNTGGEYCNCWRNPVVENVLVPLLEHRIQESNYMTTV